MDFFRPYILFCESSTYSLIQNMELMGWVSFWKGIFIDPHSTFNIFFGAYILFLPLVALLSVFASFSLNRILGLLSIVFWLTPGILSIFGINVVSADVPDSFILNSGSMYVGETKSTLYNVFIVFLFGWSLLTLFIHIFKIKRRFKEIYDHLWYVLGLSAAVIFVVNSNTSYYRVELAESESNISKVISLLLSQLNYVDSICLKRRDDLITYGVSEDFCSWVNQSKFNYFWLSEEKSFTRYLKSESDFDTLIPDARLNDISKFNDFICESEFESSYCNHLPFEFGRFSPEFDWPQNRYALAIVPLNKALSVYWVQSSERNMKLESVKNIPNSRWFFYMALGFIAGGKVANSSRSLAGDPVPIFRYWAKAAYKGFFKVFLYFSSFVKYGAQKTRNISRSIRKIPFNKWLQRIRFTNR